MSHAKVHKAHCGASIVLLSFGSYPLQCLSGRAPVTVRELQLPYEGTRQVASRSIQEPVELAYTGSESTDTFL